MSSFVVDLWESIFTPGPTAPLLKATNASFAALQLVLFGLLLATYSIHCVILSVICAGLWWSINWFAAEVLVFQQQQNKDKEEQERKQRGDDEDKKQRDDDSGTEVETTIPQTRPAPVAAAATAADVPPVGLQASELKHRAGPGTQSGVSTEDEWEKVSQTDNDKEK